MAQATPRARDSRVNPGLDAFEGEFWVGGYRAVRGLGAARHGDRCLGVRRDDGTFVVLHAVRRTMRGFGATGARDVRRFLETVAPVRRAEHAHILPVIDAVTDREGWHWLVTPYTGSVDGLLTLKQLLAMKPMQQMPHMEAGRAVSQLIEAFAAATRQGLSHGPVGLHEVLVDRHGSLHVELFGLARRLKGEAPRDPAVEVHEVRSLVGLAYELVTGVEPTDPMIAPTRLSKRLPKSWEQWLLTGLDPAQGFATHAELAESFKACLKGGAEQPRPLRETSTIEASPKAVPGAFKATQRLDADGRRSPMN